MPRTHGKDLRRVSIGYAPGTPRTLKVLVVVGFFLTMIHEQRSCVHSRPTGPILILHDSRSSRECFERGNLRMLATKNAAHVVMVREQMRRNYVHR